MKHFIIFTPKTNLALLLVGMLSLAACTKETSSQSLFQGLSSSGTSGVFKSLPEAINMGLPSGLKWASFNIGANKAEDFGDYYAWGETTTKTKYDWSTYKWCRGSYTSLTKYNSYSSQGTVDGKKLLDPADDVARSKWGGSWRMPTHDDINELINNCSAEWTTQNGVAGCKLVSKKNGNSLFFPAGGCREDASISYCGEYVFCWTSSRRPSSTVCEEAINLWCTDDGNAFDSIENRCLGMNVRPVCK